MDYLVIALSIMIGGLAAFGFYEIAGTPFPDKLLPALLLIFSVFKDFSKEMMISWHNRTRTLRKCRQTITQHRADLVDAVDKDIDFDHLIDVLSTLANAMSYGFEINLKIRGVLSTLREQRSGNMSRYILIPAPMRQELIANLDNILRSIQ